MAKREFISREEALSHPFANGKYDHKNADINFILGHESYEEWLEALPTITEQEIVKPYLDKLKAKIEKEAFTDVNNSKFISVNRVNQIFDKCKAESEDK